MVVSKILILQSDSISEVNVIDGLTLLNKSKISFMFCSGKHTMMSSTNLHIGNRTISEIQRLRGCSALKIACPVLQGWD